MAENMKNIKRRIQSVNSTEHITNAMKLVSAAKFRRAKSTFDNTQLYIWDILETFRDIFKNKAAVPERYLEGNREIKRTCYIVVTSSRGLCGGFNSNVIKETERLIKEHPASEKPSIVAVGSRGKEFFEKQGYEITREYLGAAESISFAEARSIAYSVIGQYERGEVDEVVLVTTRFINTLRQEIESLTLAPFTEETIEKITYPEELGKEETKGTTRREVEFEPSEQEIFEYLTPKFVEIVLYDAIVESATCEHAARRMAMENATDNAHEMIDVLTLYYNRARQAAITKEITEIVGGAEALA